MADITRLLARWNSGDDDALAELMPLVYSELRKLADHYMSQERTGHTLQPTALVHEAYLRLVKIREGQFNSRVHFYGAAAQAMRRILVDHARQRRASKRGGNPTVLKLDDLENVGSEATFDLIALDDALERLAAIAPRPARVVELRYFAGLTIDEVAELLEIAPATVKRHWQFARTWLHRAMNS
jgi:RNA polymerase sigma-70 factor (ECF subfamily)